MSPAPAGKRLEDPQGASLALFPPFRWFGGTLGEQAKSALVLTMDRGDGCGS
jgi:hypothetical protein